MGTQSCEVGQIGFYLGSIVWTPHNNSTYRLLPRLQWPCPIVLSMVIFGMGSQAQFVRLDTAILVVFSQQLNLGSPWKMLVIGGNTWNSEIPSIAPNGQYFHDCLRVSCHKNTAKVASPSLKIWAQESMSKITTLRMIGWGYSNLCSSL